MAKAPDLKLDELPDEVREVIEPHVVDSDAVLQEIVLDEGGRFC